VVEVVLKIVSPDLKEKILDHHLIAQEIKKEIDLSFLVLNGTNELEVI
jgi:hypothetical protein